MRSLNRTYAGFRNYGSIKKNCFIMQQCFKTADYYYGKTIIHQIKCLTRIKKAVTISKKLTVALTFDGNHQKTSRHIPVELF